MKFTRIFAALMMLVILCTVFTICTPESLAYDFVGKCGESISYFHLGDGTLYITGTGKMYNYSESDPAPWNEVADSITSVRISADITRIGEYAFADCKNLKAISGGEGVTTVGAYAFYNCTSLRSIPEGITYVGSCAFNGCTSLSNIPSNLYEVGSYAFKDCISIESASFSGGELSVGVFSGCTALKSVSLYNDLTTIPEKAFYNCQALTSISLPDSLTTIEESAFEGCSSIETFNLPNSITNIGINAFRDCSSMTSFTIPENIKSLDEGVLAGCTSLGSVAVHNKFISFGKECFKDCESLLGIILPESITELGEGVFSGCTKLASISLKGGIEHIADNAFTDCTALTYIEIPAKVESIGIEAFKGCKALSAISLNEGLLEIGNSAFADCSALTGCVLPSSISTIGDGVFAGCTSMKSVKYMGYLTKWQNVEVGVDNHLLRAENIVTQYLDGGNIGNGIYWSVSNDGCLYISGNGKMSDFVLCTTPWIKYADNINAVSVDKNITAVGAYTFSGLVGLKDFQLPEGITTISDGMFYGCTALETVTGFENITHIGSSAFEGCSSLLFDNTFDLTLGKRAFAECTSIEKISISGTVIGDEAFAGCTNLESVVIKNSVIEIGDRAFDDCPLVIANFTGNKDELDALVIGNGNNELTSVLGVYYYIRNIYLGHSANRSDAEALIAEKSNGILGFDLDKSGSQYVCLGYALTSDPEDALTGLILFTTDEAHSDDGSVEHDGITYYLISTPVTTDADGSSVYLCTTKDTTAGEPIYMVGLSNNESNKSTFREDDAWIIVEKANGGISTFDGSAVGISLFYTKDINTDIRPPISFELIFIISICVIFVCVCIGVCFYIRKKGKANNISSTVNEFKNKVLLKLDTLKNKKEYPIKEAKPVITKEEKAEKKMQAQIAKELKKAEINDKKAKVKAEKIAAVKSDEKTKKQKQKKKKAGFSMK